MDGGAILTTQNDTEFTERITEGSVLDEATDLLQIVVQMTVTQKLVQKLDRSVVTVI